MTIYEKLQIALADFESVAKRAGYINTSGLRLLREVLADIETGSFDERRYKKYHYTIEYNHPIHRSRVREKVYDSIAAIETRLKQRGVEDYSIY